MKPTETFLREGVSMVALGRFFSKQIRAKTLSLLVAGM
jgi:hypothetical protein